MIHRTIRLIYLCIFICLLTSCVSNTPETKREITTKERILPYEVACDESGRALFVHWQPAIKRMVFPSEEKKPPRRSLYSCNSEGKDCKRLVSTTEPHFFYCDLSPNGKKILFVTGGIHHSYALNVTLLNLTTNEEVEITPQTKEDSGEVFEEEEWCKNMELDYQMPTWSPKGNYILYYVSYGFPNEEGFYRIINSNTNKEVQILRDTTEPEFSPDDRYIIYSTPYIPPYIINPKDKDYKWHKVVREDLITKTKVELRQDTRGNPSTAFRWSPDGKLIAFHQKVDAGEQMCTMKPDGSNFTVITKFPEGWIATFPSWSPDSKKIAFIRKDQIFIMDIDDKNLHQLTKGKDYISVYFTTNNRILALNADGHLVLIDIIGSRKMVSENGVRTR